MTMNEAGRPEIGWAMLRGRFTSPQQKSYCGARYWGDKKWSIYTLAHIIPTNVPSPLKVLGLHHQHSVILGAPHRLCIEQEGNQLDVAKLRLVQ